MKRDVKGILLMVTMAVLLAVGSAEAANGTLKGTFAYKDPTTGVETALAGAYVYLHNAAKAPPMEKFLTKADFILSAGNTAPFSLSVAAGTYYIRILKRVDAADSSGPYGPPKTGDYTWIQQVPIKIVAGATLDLGKVYAVTYAASPVTITGRVTTATGAPVPGYYVRAQNEPCLAPVNCTDAGCQQYGNQCGQTKFLALGPTDADGNYTLMLADNGTYYIYASACLMRGHNETDPSRCPFFSMPLPGYLQVKRGDNITVNITTN